MQATQMITTFRADFPFEVGWYDCVSTPVPEAAWAAGEMNSTVLKLYGPAIEGMDYATYCKCLRAVRPSRLMLYMFWKPAGIGQEIGHVGGHTLAANVENGLLEEQNLLFRSLFEKVEKILGATDSKISPLRPHGGFQNDVVPECVLVHDTTTGEVWIAPYRIGYDIVKNCKGRGVQEVLNSLSA